MPYVNFNAAKPPVKLLIMLFSIITIGVIVFFAGLLLARVIFWMHLDQVNDVLYGRYEVLTDWQLKYFQVVQSIGFFVLPGFFLYWIFSSPEKKYFSIAFRIKSKHVFLVIILLLLSMPTINYLTELNQKISFPEFLKNIGSNLQRRENIYTQLTERLLSMTNIGYYLFNILMIAIIPAIGEELIFRGVLQKLFTEVFENVHLSILITAILFSAVHGQFFGFIPRFVLGILLGYVMIWSKSIWMPILCHFINNALAITAYYLFNKGVIKISPDLLGIENGFAFILPISIVLTALLIYFLRKTLKADYEIANS